LIYLSGGGQCSDEESCSGRFDGSRYPYNDCLNSTSSAPCYMSSKDNPKTCTKGGIFSAMNEDANVIYVPYCSSDGWMGSSSFNGWEMQGSAIALAVVDEIVPILEQLGAESLPTVVFGGGSAGGRGAAVLLDEVAARLSKVATVVGFLDSPYYSATDPYGDFEGFLSQTVDVYANFLEGGDLESTVIPNKCSAAYPNEPWKCLFGEYRYVSQTPSCSCAVSVQC